MARADLAATDREGGRAERLRITGDHRYLPHYLYREAFLQHPRKSGASCAAPRRWNSPPKPFCDAVLHDRGKPTPRTSSIH